MREISMWKYPRVFYGERRWKYPQRKFSFISPEFPQFDKGDLLKFPNKSAWKSGGRGLFVNWGQRCHYLDSSPSLSLESN